MHAVPATVQLTANEEFKRRSGRITSWGVMAAVAVHFAAFALFPQLTAADLGNFQPDDFEILELPEEIPIPPAPERIARPMTPVFTANGPDDVLFPTFEKIWDDPPLLPPPPTVGRAVEDAPVFVPRTVNPRLLNEAAVQAELLRRYPPTLREAGIGGTTTVWLLVDEQGRVAQTRIAESSDRELLDQAALAVASVMRFAPALNRDRAVAVWVSVPIRFEVRTPRP